jgi:hypothetical protein
MTLPKSLSKLVFYSAALPASLIMALSTGCASGGFHLSREYAQFVNRQPVVIRVVLYILTAFVFMFTMLIDLVIFNTVDFWNGRVSAGNYEFHKDGKTFVAHHEYQEGTKLRKSTIKILDENEAAGHEIKLVEMLSGDIEVFVDGKRRAQMKDINEIPLAVVYDESGKVVARELVPTSSIYAKGGLHSAVIAQ